jgi:polyferredoxin
MHRCVRRRDDEARARPGRYDSLRGLRGEAREIFRPRLVVYTALLAVGAIVATVAFRHRENFEANIVRLPGAPYTRQEGNLRNAFEVHVVNKQGHPETFDIEAVSTKDLNFVLPITTVELEPLGIRRVPFFVTMDQSRFASDQPFVIRVHARSGGTEATHEARAVFLGAKP